MAGSQGKKIGKFEFRRAGVDRIEVPIFLNTHTGTFTIQHIFLDLHVTGKDLESVKRQAEEYLTKRYAITWKPFLAVWVSFKRDVYDVKEHAGGGLSKTEAADDEDDDEDTWADTDRVDNVKTNREQLYGVGLRVSPVELGTYPDGEKCWRTRGSKSPIKGWPSKAGDMHYMYTRDEDAELYKMSLIEDTPDHRRALQMIFQQFCDLHRALRSVMCEENLPKLLKNVLLGRGRLMLQGAVPPKLNDSRRRPRKGKIE
jgi:hypothetical protein